MIYVHRLRWSGPGASIVCVEVLYLPNVADLVTALRWLSACGNICLLLSFGSLLWTQSSQFPFIAAEIIRKNNFPRVLCFAPCRTRSGAHHKPRHNFRGERRHLVLYTAGHCCPFPSHLPLRPVKMRTWQCSLDVMCNTVGICTYLWKIYIAKLLDLFFFQLSKSHPTFFLFFFLFSPQLYDINWALPMDLVVYWQHSQWKRYNSDEKVHRSEMRLCSYLC